MDNSFAVVTATHILTQQTRKNAVERYKAKQLLVKLLYQRKWDKQRMINFFGVSDWMMRLPEELDIKKIKSYPDNFLYVSSICL